MKNCGICNDDSVMIGHECPKPTIAELIRAKVVELDEWKHTIVEYFVDDDGNDISGYGFMAFKLSVFDSRDLNRIELDIYQDWDTEAIYIVREEYWDSMTDLTDFHIYDTRNGELYPVSDKVDEVLRDIDQECCFMDRFEGIDIIAREPTYIDEGSSDGVKYYAENHALIVIRELMSNDEDLPKHYNGGKCSDDDAFEFAHNHYSISLK